MHLHHTKTHCVAIVMALSLLGCDKVQAPNTTNTSTATNITTNTTAQTNTPTAAPTDWKAAEKQRVQNDVDNITQSMISRKPERMVEYLHPRIFELLKKSPNDMSQLLKQAGVRMNKRGITFESAEYISAPYFLESEHSQFVIVPMKRVFNMPDKKLEQQGYLFGQRQKGTEKWGYIEGKHLNDNNIRNLFPDFPPGELLPSSTENSVKKQ